MDRCRRRTYGLFPHGPAILAPAFVYSAVLAGALIHIGLDSLSVPGLPLLAPFSDLKFTAGFLPGPSLLLMAASLFFLIRMGIMGIDLPAMILPYAVVFTAYLSVRFAAFCIARTALRGKGRAVPTIDPLHWLVIDETPGAWRIGEYRIGTGIGKMETLPKFRLTDRLESMRLFALPEVRRLWFHSYIVTAETIGEEIVFSDPLRESGRVF